jgi:hypothetical protein
MAKALLFILSLYLAIGSIFAVSILSGVLRRVPYKVRDHRIVFWLTNIILFFRWTAAWLPIIMYYEIRRGR